MCVYSVYTKPAECQKLNQQNLIISRVAVDVSVFVSFNSDLYLCAFYALYSELLQSLKSIKLPTFPSLSLPFFLAHSTTKRQSEGDENKTMLTRFAGSPEKRWYSRLTVPHTAATRDAAPAMGAWTGTRHCVRAAGAEGINQEIFLLIVGWEKR